MVIKGGNESPVEGGENSKRKEKPVQGEVANKVGEKKPQGGGFYCRREKPYLEKGGRRNPFYSLQGKGKS